MNLPHLTLLFLFKNLLHPNEQQGKDNFWLVSLWKDHSTYTVYNNYTKSTLKTRAMYHILGKKKKSTSLFGGILSKGAADEG